MTPELRILAAHDEFQAWRVPTGLEDWQRDLMRADRRGTALGRLVGVLAVLTARPRVDGEAIAEAVESSLRIADTDLVFGRECEPTPLPVSEQAAGFVQASPAEVAEAYASSAAHVSIHAAGGA